SGNGYAFMAIVIHYIGNDSKLEESLIDFRELLGAHSGENVADAVWMTVDRVICSDHRVCYGQCDEQRHPGRSL
ncbi:hypothetical protein B0H10DRAFT_1855468, partial [Mycena sp. CBHHK59/15]